MNVLVRSQQDFPAFLGSQSIATHVSSLIHAAWHSARVAKSWAIPSSPWTSFVWVQHSEFNPVQKAYRRLFILHRQE